MIADNTRMKVYTRAESEAIVNQIVSENLSFGELYGSLQGKSKREVENNAHYARRRGLLFIF